MRTTHCFRNPIGHLFTRLSVFSLSFALILTVAASPARAWDAHGHRLITMLGMERLATAKNCPAWLKDPKAIAMVADEAPTPDRWRSSKVPQLKHLNDPDHYIDIEDLDDYGMTLQTVPSLRNEFIKQLALAREKAGSNFKGRPVNPARDTAKTQEWPGFALHSICEGYGKIQIAFMTVRTLEKLNDPKRAPQLEMAKANALVQIGIMSHYLGDCAQPLHTTKHHHGWIGDNPNGYTTDRGIHAYIDGGVLKLHHITADTVRPFVKSELTVNPQDPWNQVLNYVERSHAQVEPLYQLKKSGDLDKEKGKQFIIDRLADAGEFMGIMLKTAWESAEPNDKEVKDFVGFDTFELSQPAGTPAGPSKESK